MNKIEKTEKWEEIAFQIAKKYNMDLTYCYNAKRNIDTYSFTKHNQTVKKLKIEVDRDYRNANFSVCDLDAVSNTRKYTHCVCKFGDVKSIHISDLFEYNDKWEWFVDDLMRNLDFYKLNK